jgi:tRNA pseudouridine32 synthase / 23S rRNA pseudouridine746 synthase
VVARATFTAMFKRIDAPCFIPFRSSIEAIADMQLRSPFSPSPHALAKEAAQFLQQTLASLDEQQSLLASGKMFGVLVVQNHAGELGYLAAFSGKLGDTMHHPGFVPPVYDVHDLEGFFKAGEAELNAINQKISALENNPPYAELKSLFVQKEKAYRAALEAEKERGRQAKAARHLRKLGANEIYAQTIENEAIAESKRDHFILRDLKKNGREALEKDQLILNEFEHEITILKQLRAQKSAELQNRIFEEYTFLNAHQKLKSLKYIFAQFSITTPPSGAGECAGPKLLQYAYLMGLKPLAMAEFWWGADSLDKVRKHGHFYPACRSKCAPILAHMLEGLSLEKTADAPPVLQTKILFEDDWIALVQKPAGLLSVPGKEESESVQMQMKRRYPDATGPLVVHRLDQATSGVMLVAKSEEVYKQLQQQFLSKTIKKRYVAILEGYIAHDQGVITLPLRVDLDDRPRQMVCEIHGKSARTEYQVLERWDGGRRVHFSPITGRTHQLRVHAAHSLGLNAPIKGDDLYGNPSDRLYLHAEWLQFVHPVTQKRMEWECRAEF